MIKNQGYGTFQGNEQSLQFDFYSLLQALYQKHSKDSVQFSHSVVSNSFWLHGGQHTRLPCPSPTLRAYSNSCLSSRWCHSTISSSVIFFSSCLQSCPVSGSFLVSSSHQVSKVLELQLHHQSFQWIFRMISFSIDWFDLLAVQGTLKSLLQHHSSKASILQCSAFFIVQLSHPGKTLVLTIWTFVGKVISLLFNMLFRFVIAFLPRSKCLLISWLQSPSAVILEPQKIKSDLYTDYNYQFESWKDDAGERHICRNTVLK